MKKSILFTAALSVTMLMANTQITVAQNAKVADTKAVENKNQAEFKFDALEYNYGSIKQGESVSYSYKFTNVGKEPLVITSAHGSCGCTVPDWPKEPIKKGETGLIKVTFNSAGKMGAQDKTVTINSNAKVSPIVLHIKGNVEAPAQPAAGGDAH
jgi:hypothetical protein